MTYKDKCNMACIALPQGDHKSTGCAFIIKEGNSIPEMVTVGAFMILLQYQLLQKVETSMYRSVSFSQLFSGFSLIT